MEARKITIVSTKTQKKSVIMSEAETLAELKSDLRNAHIDYSDMTFYEGLTKTEITTDESLLPRDVHYKDVVTNELVFMLTNTNKKIKSGMDRKELYSKIKELGLADKCKSRYGKNFTQCSTKDLELLVIEEEIKLKSTEESVDSVATKEKSDKECPSCKSKVTPTSLEKRFESLIKLLIDKGVIDEDDLEDYNVFTPTTDKPKSSYSTSEIDDMFDFI